MPLWMPGRRVRPEGPELRPGWGGLVGGKTAPVGVIPARRSARSSPIGRISWFRHPRVRPRAVAAAVCLDQMGMEVCAVSAADAGDVGDVGDEAEPGPGV